MVGVGWQAGDEAPGLSEHEVMGKDSTSPYTHPPHPNSAQRLSTRIPTPCLLSLGFN